MTLTKDQLLNAAKSLDRNDQEELSDAIWMLAHGASEQDVQALWADEIRRRVARAERGEGSSKPVDEVVARLRAKAPR